MVSRSERDLQMLWMVIVRVYGAILAEFCRYNSSYMIFMNVLL